MTNDNNKELEPVSSKFAKQPVVCICDPKDCKTVRCPDNCEYCNFGPNGRSGVCHCNPEDDCPYCPYGCEVCDSEYEFISNDLEEMDREAEEYEAMSEDYSDYEDNPEDMWMPCPDDCDDCGGYIGKCETCGLSNYHSCAAGDTLEYCECSGSISEHNFEMKCRSER